MQRLLRRQRFIPGKAGQILRKAGAPCGQSRGAGGSPPAAPEAPTHRPRRGPAATEPRGAQGSDGSRKRGPGAQARSLLRDPGRRTVGPAGRVEEPRSRHPWTRARAPPDVPPHALAGRVTRAPPLSRRPGGRSAAALMRLQAPHPPRARAESGLIVLPGRSGPPRAARVLPGQRPAQLRGSGGPAPSRGGGSAGRSRGGGAAAAGEPPGTRGRGAPGARLCTRAARQVRALHDGPPRGTLSRLDPFLAVTPGERRGSDPAGEAQAAWRGSAPRSRADGTPTPGANATAAPPPHERGQRARTQHARAPSAQHARTTHCTHHAHACTHGSQRVLHSEARVWLKPARWLRGAAFPRAGPCPLPLSARKQGEAGCLPPRGLSQQPSGRSVRLAVLARARPVEGRRASLAACTQQRSQRSTPGAPDHQGSWERQRRRGDQKEPGTRGQRAGGPETRPGWGSRWPAAGVIGPTPKCPSGLVQCDFPVSRRQSPVPVRRAWEDCPHRGQRPGRRVHLCSQVEGGQSDQEMSPSPPAAPRAISSERPSPQS